MVPTRDSAWRMPSFLGSIEPEAYGRVEVILNDDPRSTDDIEAAVAPFADQGLTVRVLRQNRSMAAGRLEGARAAAGRILAHLDSDMTLTPGLVDEIIERIDGGAVGLVIPEESFGEGFWAQCKVLEKRCATGDEGAESLRALPAELYWLVGGHDPDLVWSEDKDLDIRVRERGGRVERTDRRLGHDEGGITFFVSLKKKSSYARTAGAFAAKHPDAFKGQSDPRRIVRMFQKAVRLGDDRKVVAGLVVLKTGEFAAVGTSLARMRAAERLDRLRSARASK